MEAKIQFIRGLSEKVLPDVRLTRSRDGSTGTALLYLKIQIFWTNEQRKKVKLPECI